MTENKESCYDCRWYQGLQHGAVGICMMERCDGDVPLKMRDETCEKFKMRRIGEDG